MREIKMADPYFSPQDRLWIHSEIDAILDSALSMGSNVQGFEHEFAGHIGVKHAIAMNSCTSVLEAALLAKGAGGHEVILPSQTFVATGMAVHLVGARPVFAEISPATLCLDLEDVKRRVTDNTAGIILVHMAGLITPDICDFRKFCDDNDLFLIEDAAHSPGASLMGQQAGTFGHIGCFSFYPTKVITSGEGGMMTTNDDEMAEFARSFQHRGKDINSKEEKYIRPGRNVRMTEMSALLGRVQLSHLSEFISRRSHLASLYKCELSGLDGLQLILPENLDGSSFWKVPIVFSPELNRTLIGSKMSNAGISVDTAYQPALHLQPVFQKLYGTTEGLLPVTEDILRRHLCLPCHPRMLDEDISYIADIVKKAIRN